MNIDLIAQLKTYDEFIAAYKDGDRNGYGTYTWADGSSESGTYKNDKRVS